MIQWATVWTTARTSVSEFPRKANREREERPITRRRRQERCGCRLQSFCTDLSGAFILTWPTSLPFPLPCSNTRQRNEEPPLYYPKVATIEDGLRSTQEPRERPIKTMIEIAGYCEFLKFLGVLHPSFLSADLAQNARLAQTLLVKYMLLLVPSPPRSSTQSHGLFVRQNIRSTIRE